MIDTFSERGQVDLKAAFADRLALWTLMTMLGLPIHDFPTIRGWFTALAHVASQFRPRSRVSASAGVLQPLLSERMPRLICNG